ncbi:MAG: FAD-binding protein [Candidatus Marinimicrobia bacterium]|nr:FAD-binding protein [Candidatus Neomarinimicrobiota bacterium]
MRLRLRQLAVPLAYGPADVLRRASRKVGCDVACLSELVIVRRSLDARARNPEPLLVLTVEVTLALAALPRGAQLADLEVIEPPALEAPPPRAVVWQAGAPRPVVVGAGPAGLMAAHRLAMAGARPILIERGEPVATRAPKVARFWNQGLLDPESNVLYGEGGAGLFSDGKLTARSKNRGRIYAFLKLLQSCGADEAILIDAEPHVGSDRLMEIVGRIRERIVAAGGEVRFRSRLEDLRLEHGHLRGIVVNGSESECTCCILAVGHSARDVQELLARRGVALEPKPFAVGIRLEIPQPAIDRAQYGRFAGDPRLGAASFRLTRRAEPGTRPCYSFCMCPGGQVISCASEPGRLTTNGMSFSHRAQAQGNAAFLVPVGPADYPAHDLPALAGAAFQRQLEQAVFTAAGGAYALAAVRLVDFLAGRVAAALPEDRSCPRATPVEFRTILPEFVTRTLEHALPAMLKELNGVPLEDALLYAPETRSSSPLWIARDAATGQSVNTRGLYPAGEGAGYAGGIVSSAIDGLHAAEQALEQWAAKPG